jgi:hypothetical protein
MNRVKAGRTYTFQPVGMDIYDSKSTAEPGQRVTVENMNGCPPANTMGHCHIVDAETGEFLGLVLCNSLQLAPVLVRTYPTPEA